MTKRRTVFGASSENVREFLNDCLASGPPEGKQGEADEMGQLLREQLSEKCPVPRSERPSRSWLLDRMQEKVLLDLSRSVGEVLSDSQAGLDALGDIKDRYKGWAQKATDKHIQHVYTALYFAAIARALVSHRRRITDHPTEYLVRSFKVLAGEPWMVSSLSELYLQALQACEPAK